MVFHLKNSNKLTITNNFNNMYECNFSLVDMYTKKLKLNLSKQERNDRKDKILFSNIRQLHIYFAFLIKEYPPKKSFGNSLKHLEIASFSSSPNENRRPRYSSA